MSKTPIILIPISQNNAIEIAAAELSKALNSKGLSTQVFTITDSTSQTAIENFLASNHQAELLENITLHFSLKNKASDVTIIPGLNLGSNPFYAANLNHEIARSLSAFIILVGTWPLNDDADKLNSEIKIAINNYENLPHTKIVGCLIDEVPTKIPAAKIENFLRNNCSSLQNEIFSLVGGILSHEKEVKDKSAIDLNGLIKILSLDYEPVITPPIFRQQLINLAQNANKKIVLPEGDEPRTLKAAIECTNNQIAECILLGDPKKIHAVSKEHSLTLDPKIIIQNPKNKIPQYVDMLVELRRHKGLTKEKAKEQLEDPVMIGTMMLHAGEVDGLVSGAVHTTANTVRPALQIIKMNPEVKLVSSVFFMCLPDQVLLFGDCAINTNPTSDELADIAIASANSALAFGIPARIAMLSYSTGESGFGVDVDKVKAATEIVQKKRPELLIDGPLQYDAAIDKEVAKLKAPKSKVAGRATIFIFPNLNCGNITYKAVQRSANIVCIGPMLQGLRKPVNDLSRGAFVEDIIFTIALTAIQANHSSKNQI